MQDLIARIVANVGIPAPLAEKGVGMLLGYLQREGDNGAVATMIQQIPGASEMIAQFNGAETEAPKSSGGMLGGLMGAASSLMGGGASGGIMAMGQSLMAEGLDMTQIKGMAEETITYAKEQAGEETVDKVVKSIPGIGAFL